MTRWTRDHEHETVVGKTSADSLEARCSTQIATRYLGCSRRHVEKLINAGELEDLIRTERIRSSFTEHEPDSDPDVSA